MCFSNLPVEFDADGNPRLVESDDEHDHAPDDPEQADERVDPETRYQQILDDLPERARSALDSTADDRSGERTPLRE